MRITRRNLLAASAVFAVTPALAQPAKNITLVVPFPPGGSTDALARLLQSHLQTRLGRTVLVENKSGAAGSLGAIAARFVQHCEGASAPPLYGALRWTAPT